MRRSHLQRCPVRNDRHRERELQPSERRAGSVPARRDRMKDHTYPRSPAVAAASRASRLAISGGRLHCSIIVEKVALNVGLAGLVEEVKFICPEIGIIAFHIRIVSHMASA